MNTSEQLNTDARKAAAIAFIKAQLPIIKNENLVYANFEDVADAMIEFAQSRPATLEKVSDEEIEEAADESYSNASVWYGGYFEPFQAGVRWRESLSEQPNQKQ